MLGFRPLGSGPLGSGALGAPPPPSGFKSYWVQHNESIGNMKKNTSGQIISAQMIAISDGSNQTTGTCNVAVEIDGSAGTGGTATHIANGKWEYAPIQADTNGDNLTFQFVITGALTVTKDVFTAFPQTVDNNVLAAGSTGFAAIDTVVDAILVDTAAMQPLVAKIPLSDGSISWNATALGAINAECDTALTDYDGPTRTEATSDKDEIVTDLDDIKGTGFVKDTHSLFDIEGYVDILDDGTSGNAKIATDVAAVLVDTGTTIPALIGTPAADISADIAAVKVDTAATLVDTAQIGVAGAGLTNINLPNQTMDITGNITGNLSGSVGSVTGGATASALATVDTNVDSILADTVILTSLLAEGTAITGTLSTTQCTTSLTEVTDDHYIGRLITFTSGVLAEQQSNITDYVGSTKLLTFTAMTEAPSNTDAFIIT